MELVASPSSSSSSPSLKPHDDDDDGGSSKSNNNTASSKKQATSSSSKCPPHGGGNLFRRWGWEWEWDMLTRFHAGYFRISLALAALYAVRCLLRFPAVRAEFRHHVAMNYLFAPWISCLLLLQSAPFLFLRPSAPPYHLLWWAFSLPILALDVKIYGQWFTRGRKFLSMVANPASHITVIGNLVTARAAARMGWHEAAVAIFAVGAAHYLVLFVTLYQRFLGSDSLPAMLRPVFFLFFAAPSMASLAWDAISASFDTCCKMLFFLSLFLFASIVSRPTLFKRAMRRFSVAWWAYSFPLTLLALASAEYAREVRQAAANALMLALAVLSVAVTLALMLFTALRTADLLPRDDPFDCPQLPPPAARSSILAS